MTRYVELRRHTDNDGDRLTPQGIADAESIAGRLSPPYVAFVSTGASRCTQMVEILRSAAGQDDVPITEASGLRSSVEDRWRVAAKAAGKGADVEAIRRVDPELVDVFTSLVGEDETPRARPGHRRRRRSAAIAAPRPPV